MMEVTSMRALVLPQKMMNFIANPILVKKNRIKSGSCSVTSRSENPDETYDRSGLVKQQKECGEET